MVTKENAAKQIILAVHDAIKESGDNGIPSGHLYVALQSVLGISLETYQTMIDLLKRSNLITDSNHLLKAK